MAFDLSVTDRHIYVGLGGESLAGVIEPIAFAP
jgi:hypothetical protein